MATVIDHGSTAFSCSLCKVREQSRSLMTTVRERVAELEKVTCLAEVNCGESCAVPVSSINLLASKYIHFYLKPWNLYCVNSGFLICTEIEHKSEFGKNFARLIGDGSLIGE